MLNEVPQTTSIEARFSSIEDSLKQVNSIPSFDTRSRTFENYSTIEIANELDDRQRRKGNLILHNVPESDNPRNDEDTVSNILKYVLGKEFHIQSEATPSMERLRIYRLGRRIPGVTRSIKCHLKSETLCNEILMQSRKLTKSLDFYQVVLQQDLTFLQRSHLKQLVREKRSRNNHARDNNEESDWIIRDGQLFRKRDLYD